MATQQAHSGEPLMPVPGFVLQALLQAMGSPEIQPELPAVLQASWRRALAANDAGEFVMSRAELQTLLLAFQQSGGTLALRLGKQITEPNLNVLGPIIVASRTIREAFERCDSILNAMQMKIRGRMEILEHEVRYTVPNLGLGTFWEDLSVSLVVHTGLRFVQGALPHRRSSGPLFMAHFERPCPEDVHGYESCFGYRPEFGAEQTCVTFARELLDLPRPGTDPVLAAELHHVAQRRLRPAAATNPWSARLEGVLRSRGNLSSVDFHKLAEGWGITHRALRRHLAAEGESTSRVLERVRLERAKYYLTQTPASLAEIADTMGYADVTSLRRAFKRWTGQSPQSYRKTHREE